MDLLTGINEAEEQLLRLFSEPVVFSENLVRYKDDDLADMYDLNYFRFSPSVTYSEIAHAIEYQKNRGDGFFKLNGKSQLDDVLLKAFSLESYCDITMLLKKGQPNLWTRNKRIEIQSLRDNDIEEDLVSLELSNFGQQYGSDFAVRKMRHWISTAKISHNLNFYAAFINGKICGSLYTYLYNGFLNIDGLNVAPEHRNNYIATSLLSECIIKEGGCPFLHADPDDTPKNMYAKLGFEIVDKIYWYQLMFR